MSIKYSTEIKVETFLGKSIATGAADDALLAADKIIDQYTGRNFKADSAASARKFDGSGEQNLLIDDCTAITKVELGSNSYGDSLETITAGGSGGYYLLPNNYDKEGVPIVKIHLRSRYWVKGLQNHQITAKWGYSATPPDDIVYCATFLAAKIYEFGRGGAVGGVKSESIGNYSISFKDDKDATDFEKVKAILDSYKKYNL